MCVSCSSHYLISSYIALQMTMIRSLSCSFSIQVLTLRGDLKQLRWLFHTTLGDAATAMVSDKDMVVDIESSALAVRTSNTTGKTKTNQTSSKSNGHFERSMKDQLVLWEEYLKAETVHYLIYSYICFILFFFLYHTLL